MKKIIQTASLLLALVITLPVYAEVAHHPENQAAPEMTQIDTGKIDTSVQQMQEMRKRIATEKDPATRNELMHQHMQMMQDGMNMMTMMGGQGMMMGEQPGMMKEQDTSAMPMADRMTMMEKKMAMMGQGGMMSPCGMMGMMEKKMMMMMQEIMNGMMMQQKMMMK
jgi:hypothetical protein